MNLYGYEFQRDSDLAHYGVLGMRWGVRRYQNADGTLTNAGKKRYDKEEKQRGLPDRDYRIASAEKYYSNTKADKTQYSLFENWYGKDEKDSLEKSLNTACITKSYLKTAQGDFNAAHNKYADLYDKFRPLTKYAKETETYQYPDGTYYGRYDYVRPINGFTSDMASAAYENGDISKQEYYELLRIIKDDDEKFAYKDLKRETDRLEKAMEDNHHAQNAFNDAKRAYGKTPMSAVSKLKQGAEKAISFIFSLFKKKK